MISCATDSLIPRRLTVLDYQTALRPSSLGENRAAAQLREPRNHLHLGEVLAQEPHLWLEGSSTVLIRRTGVRVLCRYAVDSTLSQGIAP